MKDFLTYVYCHTGEFNQATREQVIASVANHCKWLDSDETKRLIEELKRLRDKELAHLDKIVVKNFCDGDTAEGTYPPQLSLLEVSNNDNSSLELMPLTLVEKVAEIFATLIEIVNVYSRYYDGRTFDMDNMRDSLQIECGRFVEFCHQRDRLTE